MKKIPLLFLVLTILLTHKVMAQSASPASQETMLGDINLGVLEQYIQSAKENYPHVKLLQEHELSAKSAIGNSAVSYFDIFNLSYIYRPNSETAIASPGVTSNPYSVNGFQLGVNFNLGTFLEKPFTAKKAKVDYKATQYETKEYLSTLELEVKKRYYAYIQQVRQLKILADNVEIDRVIFEKLKTKFEKGEALLEIYMPAQTALTGAVIAKIQCEGAELLAQASLEEIIGKKLTDFK